jgi:hypothetical protein
MKYRDRLLTKPFKPRSLKKIRYGIPRSPFHKITLKHDRRKKRYEIPRSLLHKITLNRDRQKIRYEVPRSPINLYPKKAISLGKEGRAIAFFSKFIYASSCQ